MGLPLYGCCPTGGVAKSWHQPAVGLSMYGCCPTGGVAKGWHQPAVGLSMYGCCPTGGVAKGWHQPAVGLSICMGAALQGEWPRAGTNQQWAAMYSSSHPLFPWDSHMWLCLHSPHSCSWKLTECSCRWSRPPQPTIDSRCSCFSWKRKTASHAASSEN